MSTLKKLTNLSKILTKIGKYKETFQIADMATKNYAVDEENDLGKKPWVTNIEDDTLKNENFRTTKWTGEFFQMTLMSLDKEEEVGLEVHQDVDQFIRIEQGKARVIMGESKDDLNQEWLAEDDFAIFIPAGFWHNIINVGNEELKLYSIYAKPEHPKGTVHKTYDEAMEDEEHHNHADDKPNRMNLPKSMKLNVDPFELLVALDLMPAHLLAPDLEEKDL